jgi:DNA helicase-2/ATP-dependent DNA helicase PcrA
VDNGGEMTANDYESIVTITGQPALVLAGPGAGKTHLLGDRVKRLLDAGVDKNKITVLTFGRDASQHMRNKLLDPKDGFGIPYESLPNISTLHSLGFEIVNRMPRSVGLRKTELRVQSEEEVKRLLYRDAALIIGGSESEAKAAQSCKQYGNCNIDIKKATCNVCKKYWEIMSKCNCIDFDDQVLFACQILENNPDILNEYQNRSLYLLVDEYQDINAAQFKLIVLLSNNSREGLFAVGDDAQSIYRFRGADPAFILRFSKDFPGAAIPPLAHSRRCHEQIVQDAERVLKKYYPEWTGPHKLTFHVPPGEPPIILQVPSDRGEADLTARIARQAITEKKTVLILAPKREFFPRISLALRGMGIPHERPGNLLATSVNNRLEVIFILLEWLGDPTNNFLTRLAVESLINNGIAKVPGTDKGGRCRPETLERRISVETEIANLWEKVGRKNSLLEVIKELTSASTQVLRVRDTLNALLGAYSNSKGEFRGEFAKRLALASGSWVDPSKFLEDLFSVRETLSYPQPTGFGAVQLMTMRKAKGLEADIVVIVGLEDDIMPNPISDLKEEARLFYVSMTRAKDRLFLIHSYKRLRNISFGPEITGKRRSRFLDSMGKTSKYVSS